MKPTSGTNNYSYCRTYRTKLEPSLRSGRTSSIRFLREVLKLQILQNTLLGKLVWKSYDKSVANVCESRAVLHMLVRHGSSISLKGAQKSIPEK